VDVFDFRERGNSGVDDETEELARLVIGAAIEVHRHLGPGLPENTYRNALSHEMDLRGIPHAPEAKVPIHYKGKQVGDGSVDILVAGRLVLELKVVEALNDIHRSQVISYLRALRLQLGLLLNFNVDVMRDGIRRVVVSIH